MWYISRLSWQMDNFESESKRWERGIRCLWKTIQKITKHERDTNWKGHHKEYYNFWLKTSAILQRISIPRLKPLSSHLENFFICTIHPAGMNSSWSSTSPQLSNVTLPKKMWFYLGERRFIPLHIPTTANAILFTKNRQRRYPCEQQKPGRTDFFWSLVSTHSDQKRR